MQVRALPVNSRTNTKSVRHFGKIFNLLGLIHERADLDTADTILLERFKCIGRACSIDFRTISLLEKEAL